MFSNLPYRFLKFSKNIDVSDIELVDYINVVLDLELLEKLDSL